MPICLCLNASVSGQKYSRSKISIKLSTTINLEQKKQSLSNASTHFVSFMPQTV